MKSKLLKLIGKSPFDTKYAKTRGCSSRMLSYFEKKGKIIRLAYGVYSFPGNLAFDFESLLREKLIQAPQAVIGMHTALKFYNLTDESPSHIDLLVPESNIPKKKMTDVKLHPVTDHLLKRGVIKIRKISITSLERTLIDILRKKGTIKEAVAIIHLAQKRGLKIDFSEIENLGILFRVRKKVLTLLEIL
jgi:predicted transcriptional regulator of viral defense system